MRLFSGKISGIVDDILVALIPTGDIEVTDKEEVRLDLEAVLKGYVRQERRTVDEAKDRLEREGLGYAHMHKMRARIAKERGLPPQDEVLPYLLEQLMTMLFHSGNVEEIYADDIKLRKTITPILRRHMEVESDLDREVRSKIRNLDEGTQAFEVEYARVMDKMKRRMGLES